jgi:hypothetical protein
MRRPSRFMPKYIPKRPGVLGCVLFATIMVGFVFALYRLTWLFGSLGVIGIVVTLVLNRNFKARLTALAALRNNESICTFAKSFNPREVDTWVIRAVYEQLQDYLVSTYPQFPIRAEDRLNGCLITDPDDLDLDLAKEISERTGRSIDDTKSNPYYAKVKTVRDLVLFFNSQPVANKT